MQKLMMDKILKLHVKQKIQSSKQYDLLLEAKQNWLEYTKLTVFHTLHD